MDSESIVCVFAKAPRAGEVKTRLASSVGKDAAAALAQAFLDDTLEAMRGVPWARPVIAAAGAFDHAARPGAEIWQQGQGDLGARIERVLSRALSEAPAAIAIGADTPGLPPARLEAARKALRTASAAIGPCDDGGFYLLGLRRCPPGLLEGLPWSAPDTFHRTLARLRERGLRTVVLDPWFDVDRAEDLDHLEGLIERGEIRAPRTAEVIARLQAPRRLSVILPVLDEERRVGRRLEELSRTPAVDEVIVVDGGSTDRTVAVASGFSGVRVVGAPRGRARQMNAGAAVAAGDVLLFLHADVSLPSDAAKWIDRALGSWGAVAGAFRTWTVNDEGSGWIDPALHLADLRSRYSGLPYGDQALFVRAEVFRRIGGFPDVPLMEDLALSRRLRAEGEIAIVPACVRVSGRRFQARPVFYTLLVNALPLFYRLGVPPRVFARLYGNPR